MSKTKLAIVCINVTLMLLAIAGIIWATILATNSSQVIYELTEKGYCSGCKSLICGGTHNVAPGARWIFWPSLLVLIATVATNIACVFTDDWKRS